MTQNKKRKFMLLAAILGALLLVALGTVLFNRVGAEYRSLNDADQQLLREFSQYCEQTQRADIWNGFNLSHRTVLAIGGLFQPSYLINPSAEVRSPFAVKLKMPEDIPLEVYRLSWLTPQVMKWKLSIGNFNEIGQTYRLWGNELYYMQYTQIRKFWDRAQSGGRKSVRLEELDPEWFFQLKNGYFVPYLDLIQKDLETRD